MTKTDAEIISLNPVYSAPTHTPDWIPDGCLAWVLERNGLGKRSYFRGVMQVVTGSDLASGYNAYFMGNKIPLKAERVTLAVIKNSADFSGSTGNFFDYHFRKNHDILFEREGPASTNLFLCESYNRLTGDISSIVCKNLYSTKQPVRRSRISQQETKRGAEFVVISKGAPCPR